MWTRTHFLQTARLQLPVRPPPVCLESQEESRNKVTSTAPCPYLPRVHTGVCRALPNTAIHTQRFPCVYKQAWQRSVIHAQASHSLLPFHLTEFCWKGFSFAGSSGFRPAWSLSWGHNPYCLLKHSPCCCLVAQSCPTLCDPMDCSAPDFPVLYLPELYENSWPLIPYPSANKSVAF